MLEIIIAIILQLTIVLNSGTPAEKAKAEKELKALNEKKAKAEQAADGGTGNWNDD